MANGWLRALPLITFVGGLAGIAYLTQCCGWHGAEVIAALALVIIWSLGLGKMI